MSKTPSNLRSDYRKLQRAVPLRRRRLFWGVARYECRKGLIEEEGPFQGDRAGGCGWGRNVLLSPGVGRSPGSIKLTLPLPTEAGICQLCQGPLSLIGYGAVGTLGIEASAPKHEPILIVPGRSVSSRLARDGIFQAQLFEPKDFLDDD